MSLGGRARHLLTFGGAFPCAMTGLMRFETDSGQDVFVEVKENVLLAQGGDALLVPEDALRKGFLPQVGVKDAGRKLSDAVGILRPIVDAVTMQLDRMQRRPDEATLTLGIAFGGGVDAKIVSSKADATMELTLTWKSAPPPK